MNGPTKGVGLHGGTEGNTEMKFNTRTTVLAGLAGAAMIVPLAMSVPAQASTHHAPASRSAAVAQYGDESDGYSLVLGTRRDDTLFGSHGDDAIFGFAGNDRLISRGGDDLMFGGKGDDTLIDNSPSFFGDHVTLRGGAGYDVCIGNDNDDFFNCEDVIIL